MISLVQMPFADLDRPSIGLGLIKAVLLEAGIPARVTYANLQFAESVGLEASLLPQRIWPTSLVGEWVFVPAVFPDFSPPDDRYLEECVGPFARHYDPSNEAALSRAIVAELRRLRASSAAFVDHLAHDLLRDRPAVLGCSSMFSQQLASLALLRRVRELDPGVVTLLGGANVEGDMGDAVIRTFPFVDAVCSGEAEDVVVPLCRAVLDRGRAVLKGPLPEAMITRVSVGNRDAGGRAPRATVARLDSLPVPDYDDYFGSLAGLPLTDQALIRPSLPAETSRGCWWKCSHGCTFCGLNRGAESYRAKSPSRAVAEIETLTERHGSREVAMVDNLPPRGYLSTFFTELSLRSGPFDLYYEIRPVLTREETLLLADAGVRHVQAGIEALHDGLLIRMNKGTTALQNIAFLTHAHEFGIRVGWHLLTGFPGDEDEWYRETTRILQLLRHLPPPASVHGITLQRFSTYHEEPARHGLRLVPYNSYAFVYPYGESRVRELAYYFRDESWPEFYPEMNRDTPGTRLLVSAVDDWRAAHDRPDPPGLIAVDHGEDGLELRDSRDPDRHRSVVLTALAAEVYRAAADPIDRTTLDRRLRARGVRASSSALEDAISELTDPGFLLDASGAILAVATPPPRALRSPFSGAQVLEDAFRRFLSRICPTPAS